MQEQIFLSVPLNDFKLLMIDVVNNCLQHSGNPAPPPLPDIVNRKELRKRLGISEPTVIRWEKKKKLPSFRIGSNVRYNWQTVIDALEGKAKGGASK